MILEDQVAAPTSPESIKRAARSKRPEAREVRVDHGRLEAAAAAGPEVAAEILAGVNEIVAEAERCPLLLGCLLELMEQTTE